MGNSEINRKNIWEETSAVRFGAVDRSDRLTLASVFNFFQEAAISHAENLGVGRKTLTQARQAWILSRMSVEINRRPKYGEAIRIRTWPRGMQKLFALRNYDIQDAQGVPVVWGRSCWLIVDMEKRRPLRPQSIVENLPLNEGIDVAPCMAAPCMAAPYMAAPFKAMSSEATALAQRPNLVKKIERVAAYSSLDYNGHVNNVSYIQWIQDTLDPALLENASQMRLDINYINEVLPGQTTEIWLAELDDNLFAIEGRKSGKSNEEDANGGQVSFRAELWLNSEETF